MKRTSIAALLVAFALVVPALHAQSTTTENFSGTGGRCDVYLASAYLAQPVSIGAICNGISIAYNGETTATHAMHFSIIETNGAFANGSMFVTDHLGNIVFLVNNYAGTFTWNNLNAPAAIYTITGSYSGPFPNGSTFTGTATATIAEKLVRFYRGGGSYVWYVPTLTGANTLN
jgi:hypothetical protein